MPMNIKDFSLKKSLSGFRAISGHFPDIAEIIKNIGIFYE